MITPILSTGSHRPAFCPVSVPPATLQNWIDDFDYMAETHDWGVITYTFHPFVIGRGHRMKILTRLLDHLSAKGAIFMTMEAAAAERHPLNRAHIRCVTWPPPLPIWRLSTQTSRGFWPKSGRRRHARARRPSRLCCKLSPPSKSRWPRRRRSGNA